MQCGRELFWFLEGSHVAAFRQNDQLRIGDPGGQFLRLGHGADGINGPDHHEGGA